MKSTTGGSGGRSVSGRDCRLGANWVFDIAALLADEMAGNFVLSRDADSLAVVRETFHFEPGAGFSFRLQPRL
ncbi:MAG: hypothetical protein MUE79_03075 [Nitratireductor sp.]|nr:hypothetical protein [Nitratireductor sp.]